jgi:uncharacterized protein (TIGR01777 family)
MADGVRLLAWDARSAEGWGALADGAQAIVNLAGAGLSEKRWSTERKRLIRDSRVHAGRAVTEAVRNAETKPQVVVQSSAVGYYGPRGDEILTEDALAGADFLADVCLDWEASTREVEELGVRRAVVRSGVVLATHGGALPEMARPMKLFVGGPVGSGRQWLSWIHLADEVAAIRALIDDPQATGAFNLVGAEPVTNRAFMTALGQALHRPAVVPAPAFALKLLYGEMSTVVLDGQRAVPQHLAALGFRHRFPEVDAALADLYG